MNATCVKLLKTRELCTGCEDLRHGSIACWLFGRGFADPEPYGKDFGILAAIVAANAAIATMTAMSGIALSQSDVKVSTVDKHSEEIADNWKC